MEKSIIKLPRLYTHLDLIQGGVAELEGDKTHYLKNVMRKDAGDSLRLFNGRDGEWLCAIERLSKKYVSVQLVQQIREQCKVPSRIHGFFPPIKKQRMDFLIEKAVELGVTDLHPILTEYTDVRKVNEERICAQIIEAAEQCERLDIPTLYAVKDLRDCFNGFHHPIYAALERYNNDQKPSCEHNEFGVIVGPEGGFSDTERDFLKSQTNVGLVSLGENILRTETAFLKILCTI